MIRFENVTKVYDQTTRPALDTGADPVCLQTVRNGAELFSSPALRS